MGRKKKGKDEEQPAPPPPREEEEDEDDRHRDDSDSSDVEVERRHHDIMPDVQELAYSFGIDFQLTQKLNDIMVEERQRTWKQDLDRLYELLKEARTPAAVLRLKIRDMEKGKFVGKAKCGPKVRELARKHRLDKGAATKLEEAMSMREAMGKDTEKDLMLLDEHLAASNAPSKLVSMKLETLRKGFNLGHCIYSRETIPGNQGPGVDGVFDKRERRTLGYTDADLGKRFSESTVGRGDGQLMDEATVLKLMAAERRKMKNGGSEEEEKPKEKERAKGKKEKEREKERHKDKEKDRDKTKDKRSRSRSRRGRKKSGSKSRSRSAKKDKKGSSRSRRSPSRTAKRKKSRSRSPKKRQREASCSASPPRAKASKCSPAKKASESGRGRARSSSTDRGRK